MSFIENSKVRRPKFNDQEKKETKKVRQLEKEQERYQREPSNRLGKTAKKLEARRKFVASTEKSEEDIIEENLLCEDRYGTLQVPKKVFGRPKRKPSHRDRPEEFHDDDYQYRDLTTYGILEMLEEIDKEINRKT